MQQYLRVLGSLHKDMTQFSGSYSGVPALCDYGICGISYLVVSVKGKKVYGGAVTYLQTFSISALDGSELSARRHQRFIPGKIPEDPLNGWVGGIHRPSGYLGGGISLIYWESKEICRLFSQWPSHYTGYDLDGPGSNPSGGEFFRTLPDWPWGPPSLL